MPFAPRLCRCAAVLALLLPAAFAAAEPPATPAAAPAVAPAPAPAPAPASPIEAARQAATTAGVKIVDLRLGKGKPALEGATVRVHYTGWLLDPSAADGKGTKFDSSLDRNDPFLFPLGQQKVIRGWDLGVAGMQPGGKRRLTIPPDLAYGARGAGGLIPPNATLLFEVELFDFLPPLAALPKRD
jgi:FKBP-type peptidyl-prolyl cis-trans isomerase FkpA